MAGQSFSDKLLSARIIWILLIVIVLVSIPLIRPMGLPFPVDAAVNSAFNTINNLPAGSTILWYTSEGFAQLGETGVVTRCLLRVIFTRPLKLVLIPTGADTAAALDNAFRDISKPYTSTPAHDAVFKKYGKTYGTDYVIMPWLTGGAEIVLAALALDFPKTHGGVDNFNTPMSQLPVVANVKDISAFKLFIMQYGLSDGCDPGIRQITTKFETLTMLSGFTSGLSYGAQYYPQVVAGLVFGQTGASMMELISGLPGDAIKWNDSKSLLVFFTDILIVLGTILFYQKRLFEKVRPPVKVGE